MTNWTFREVIGKYDKLEYLIYQGPNSHHISTLPEFLKKHAAELAFCIFINDGQKKKEAIKRMQQNTNYRPNKPTIEFESSVIFNSYPEYANFIRELAIPKIQYQGILTKYVK